MNLYTRAHTGTYTQFHFIKLLKFVILFMIHMRKLIQLITDFDSLWMCVCKGAKKKRYIFLTCVLLLARLEFEIRPL